MISRSRLMALSLLSLLSACQAAPLNSLPANNTRMMAASQQMNQRNDWFSQLSPALQNHYAEARGLTGQALFNALSSISARGHRALSYGEARNFMYSTADNFKVQNRPGVVDVYSDLFIPGSTGDGNQYREQGDQNKDGTSGDFINCEHTWPQSFFSKATPMVSDMHHLFPTLSKPNGMRGHHPFGMSNEGKVTYSTSSGSKLVIRSNRVVASTVPADPEEGVNQFSNQDAVFEPGNAQKGNTARAMFYFWMRYRGQNVRGGDFNQKNFWSSRVSMFRQWSDQVDPIDERERTRHEIVAQRQGNRNPFIDIPNLATLIGEEVLTRP